MANAAPDTRPISRTENPMWRSATYQISGSEIPEGWEIWDDDQARAIMARPDVIHPLIINRSDERAPIGMYIQWAPRVSDD